MSGITKKKIKLIAIIFIIVIFAILVIGFICKYMLEDRYKNYLSGYTIEKGYEFKELKDSSEGINGFVLAAENEQYKLYTNLKTTEIALMKKSTGEIIYSNPQDRDGDSIATETNINELNATMVVKYYNSARTSATMTNYEMSIKSGQFTLEALENGIRYLYTLADSENGTGIIPFQISEERMKTLILNKLSEKESMTFTGAFKLTDDMYYLTESAKIAPITISKLTKLLGKAGYTEEDFKVDNAGLEDERVGFVIPLEYRLVENGLKVSIPTGMIEESGDASIYRIQLLKYMGAEKTANDGYIMVPNGSGSLINFKEGVNSQPGYSQYIYGTDPVMQSYVVLENSEDARLPVYGIKCNNTCLFSIVTDGAALASINADTAGKSAEYNYAYASFSLREMELLNMFGISGSRSDTPSLEKNFYDVILEEEYTILSDGNANYSGMANYYRDYLEKQGVLTDIGESEAIPLYLEIIGGVEKTEHLLGVPYRDVYPMTTYKQTEKIIRLLYDQGITNIRADYVGWFNRGIYHDVADKINLIHAIGSKQDLENLSKVIEANGGKLYVETAFNKVPNTTKRYQMKLQSSKYYSGYVVSLGAVNPSTLRQTSNLGWYNELTYSILSPRYLPVYVQAFADEIEDFDVSGVALRDLGIFLASDKKKNNLINRDEAYEITEGMLGILNEKQKDLLVKGGNEYALKYADDLTCIPTNDNEFDIIDQEIPFYEMVLHGYKSYAGNPLNLVSNYNHEDTLLKYIEYGVYPNFAISYQDSTKIKYTSSADLFAVQYTTWIDEICKLYRELNSVLGQVSSAKITDHTVLENGMVKITYSNGVMIYINYSEEILTDGEYEVDPSNFKVIGGNN